MRLHPLLISLLMLLPTAAAGQADFVTVRDGHFYRGDAPYYFLGTNFWYGLNLGSEGPGGDRARLRRELDRLQEMGVTNLRIMGASEGPDGAPWRMAPALQPARGQYNAAVWDGLDFLLAEMSTRDMTAVVCLNNFWPWSGGMAQYLAWETGDAIPYPPPAEGGDWASYQLFTTGFYKHKAAMAAFEAHLDRIIQRINPYTGRAYRDDPTIMSWQLANEPRGILRPRAYRRWIQKTAAFIKKQAPHHLVSLGSEGATSSSFAGTRFTKDHRFDVIDYTTIHIWVQNWGWYDPERPESLAAAQAKAQRYLLDHVAEAQALNKPLVLEEFGISRDGDDHDPQAPTAQRDAYYAFMFGEIHRLAAADGPVAGCNFWAWGGEGRPRVPHAVWQAGDDFIGDPPHEYQGWYSVYDRDASTRAVIRTWAARMAALGKE